ncbi:MAG: DUF2278 family protein [Gammaproteobacteria bacterium]
MRRQYSSPHFQIRVVDEAGTDYRVAVNVKSRLAPSELMYHIKSHFVRPVRAGLRRCARTRRAPDRPHRGRSLLAQR